MFVLSRFAAVFGALSFIATPVFAGPTKTTFVLTGQTYSVTVPTGYCLPTTPAAQGMLAQMRSVSAGNIVDLAFLNCDAVESGAKARRMGSIATPKASLTKLTPSRSVALAQMKMALANGSLNRSLNAGRPIETASKTLSELAGHFVNLTGQPRFTEVDEKAAYLSGMISGGEQNPTGMFLASALTTIKGRTFIYSLSEPYTDEASAKTLMSQLKIEVARFIADNGG